MCVLDWVDAHHCFENEKTRKNNEHERAHDQYQYYSVDESNERLEWRMTKAAKCKRHTWKEYSKRTNCVINITASSEWNKKSNLIANGYISPGLTTTEKKYQTKYTLPIANAPFLFCVLETQRVWDSACAAKQRDNKRERERSEERTLDKALETPKNCLDKRSNVEYIMTARAQWRWGGP